MKRKYEKIRFQQQFGEADEKLMCRVASLNSENRISYFPNIKQVKHKSLQIRNA